MTSFSLSSTLTSPFFIAVRRAIFFSVYIAAAYFFHNTILILQHFMTITNDIEANIHCNNGGYDNTANRTQKKRWLIASPFFYIYVQ